MKRHCLIVVLLGALMLPLMVSCTKPDDDNPSYPNNPENPIDPDNPIGPIIPDAPEDIMGVYNPGKKIKKVYELDSYSGKYLSEVWNWDRNILESIDHYDREGSWQYKESYTYDNHNRLTLIDYNGSQSGKNVVFRYDDGNLKSISVKTNSSLSQNTFYYDFKYQNGKLIEYSYEYSYQSEPNPNGPKYTLQLVWSNDNLEQGVMKYSGSDGVIMYNYMYDTNHNPKKGLLARNIGGGFAFSLSENNVIKSSCSNSNSDYVDDYDYQYDTEGYPSFYTKTSTIYNPVGSVQAVYYFEYE